MKILVVGDSISMGYIATVALKLADLAEVVHSPGSGDDSSNVLANIDTWLLDAGADIVVLNCGLHDLKRRRGKRNYQVAPDQYRSNLEAILKKVRAADCGVFWITTTPVIDTRHQKWKRFDRHNVDVTKYNDIAGAIATDARLGVIDLHKVALHLGLETALGKDGVHFTTTAYERLGAAVARALREHLTV